MRLRLVFLFLTCLSFICQGNAVTLSLKNNLQNANKGDFIVASQNKNYTLLHIFDKTPESLIIEEITVPAARMPKMNSWRDWVRQCAPNHTSWILYNLNLSNGSIKECYSVSQESWLDMSKGDMFLPTLLNLQFSFVPITERRKIGPPPNIGSPDRRAYWQPKMVIDGKQIPNVSFVAWRTYWPKDNSPLADKTIDIYIPENQNDYPSYFPYWLEIRGSITGKATVHVIDSGRGLVSPAPPLKH
jgi:hypothetical protein